MDQGAAGGQGGGARRRRRHAQAKGPDLLATRFTAIRDHFAALAAVIPQMPAEFQRARDALMAETHGRGLVVVLLAVFIGLGLGVAWLFLWATRGLRRRSLDLPMETVGQRLIALIARLVYGVLLVAAFGLGSIGAFLIFDWPPLLREILLQYLMAFLEFCLVAGGQPLPPGAGRAAVYEDVDRFRILPMDRAAARFWHRRILVLAGWYAFGYATVMLLSELGFDLEARRLVAYILGLGLLAIGLEMVWRHPPTHAEAPAAPFLKRRAIAWLLSILFLLLWLLWVASAVRGMWLLAVLIALPWAIRGARRAVGHLLRPPGNAEAADRSALGADGRPGARAAGAAHHRGRAVPGPCLEHRPGGADLQRHGGDTAAARPAQHRGHRAGGRFRLAARQDGDRPQDRRGADDERSAEPGMAPPGADEDPAADLPQSALHRAAGDGGDDGAGRARASTSARWWPAPAWWAWPSASAPRPWSGTSSAACSICSTMPSGSANTSRAAVTRARSNPSACARSSCATIAGRSIPCPSACWARSRT